MKKFLSLEDLLDNESDLIVVKEVHSEGDILDDEEPTWPQAITPRHLQHIAVGDQEVPDLSSPTVVAVPDDLNGTVSVVSNSYNRLPVVIP